MYKTIKAQTDGSFSTQELLGEEFLVVPVTAMVEGVRFGANSDGNGELGLVTEFGKFPDGWNNRPVVMNHPQINGNFVSANSPAVLDQFSLGTTMKTEVVDNKLQMQAWLSKAQEEGSEERLDVIERIESGETIEVSVGFFTEVRAESGTFEGVNFSGVWENIVPDHLAFLSEGTIGACSVADGCGANREQIIANISNISGISSLNSNSNNLKNQGVSMTSKMFKFLTDKGPAKNKVVANCGGCSGCANKPETLTSTISKSTVVNNDGEDNKSAVMLSEKEISALQHFLVQAIPEGIISADIMQSLENTIADQNEWSFVLGFTASHVIFETWSSDKGRWVILQQAFDMDADGKTSFSSDPEEINLLTRIVPVTEDVSAGDVNVNQPTEEDVMSTITTEEGNGNVTANSAADASEAIPAESAQAAETPKVNETAPAEAFGEGTPPVVNGAAEVTAQSAPQAKPTVQEYIANAPVEVQEILKESLATHESAKASLIKGIQETGRNTFTAEYLKAQTVETLRGLSKLSNVPDYSGQAIPAPTVQDSSVPAAPRLSAKS